MTLKQKADVLNAALEGKTIQAKQRMPVPPGWVPRAEWSDLYYIETNENTFNFSFYNYRVKPETKFTVISGISNGQTLPLEVRAFTNGDLAVGCTQLSSADVETIIALRQQAIS